MSATRITPPPVLLSFVAAAVLYALLARPDSTMLVPLVGALALTGAVWRLLRTLNVPHAARWAAVTLALPATALNAGLLGRSDAMWAVPCLLALDAAIQRRHGMMLLWCGLGLVCGPQALLFAPFVVALLINRRVPIATWLPGLAFTMAVLLLDLSSHDLKVLWRQPFLRTGHVWSVLAAVLPLDRAQLAGLAIVGTAGAIAWYVARFSAQPPISPVRLLPVALLATLVTTALSTGGFVLAGVIAAAWAISVQDRRAWRVAVLIQTASALSIAGDLTGQNTLGAVAFVAVALATWLMVKPLAGPAANDNAPMTGAWRRRPLPPMPSI
ncbi:hypothetical protein [Sphingomonas sp. GC_Shp_3]|uniref:hypothetical protein n=1 Tax=Sphingomonas sp. GC_Shp_3 TaxID=2937383 RepID=UPI002269A287|nr:hypothetical protein [Sphingomonas sp. GC_Shp_3]